MSTHTLPNPKSPSAPLDSDAEALHEAVSDLVRIYQFRDRDRICCYDISVTQCYALEILEKQGPLRSQALAAELRLDKSTTTRVADALVRKGYVERGKDADDGRAVALAITPQGRELFGRIHRELVGQQAELLSDLDPSIRASALEVIRRLVRHAEARFVAGVSCDNGGDGKGCC